MGTVSVAFTAPVGGCSRQSGTPTRLLPWFDQNGSSRAAKQSLTKVAAPDGAGTKFLPGRHRRSRARNFGIGSSRAVRRCSSNSALPGLVAEGIQFAVLS